METSKIIVPVKDIYKVFLLGANGNTERIYVFSRKNNVDIFSESELNEYKTKGIEIVYSESQIHKDDSIRIIKKKIINEIGINEICYDEIYLFLNVLETVNVLSLYQLITKNDNLLTPDALKQLLLNMNLSSELIEENLTLLGSKESYSYEDLLKVIKSEETYSFSIPFGQRFSEERDYIFSSNPYKLFSSSIGNIDYTKNSLLSFENQLLLNYGNIENNNIYLCRVTDVFEFSESLSINSDYISQTYFPLLYKKSITSNEEFISDKQTLIKQNEELLNKKTQTFYETVDIFYDVYNGRGSNELSYLNRGIKEFEIKIKSDLNNNLPLEVIFKNIHSTIKIPFIKFNPGNRRENIYRLYTQKRTADGKNIPYLSESMVTKLSKEIGKKKQISLFIQYIEKEDTLPIHIFLDLDTLGDVTVYADLKKTISENQLVELLKNAVNPVIDNINEFLESTGYTIRTIKTIKEHYIEVINIKYTAEYILEKELNLGKYIGCITSIFDIERDDESTGTVMRFKRVENFQEMNAQTLLIRETISKTGDITSAISALMKNYKMTEDTANMRIVTYLSEHKDIRGKMIDNPGFPTLFKISKLEKKLYIEVNNIISIEYLNILHVYIDSILRITQVPDTTIVPKEHILSLCTKAGRLDKNVDRSHVQNVISTTIELSKPKQLQPIQLKSTAISGLLEDEDDEESDDEMGIFYDDEDENDSNDSYPVLNNKKIQHEEDEEHNDEEDEIQDEEKLDNEKKVDTVEEEEEEEEDEDEEDEDEEEEDDEEDEEDEDEEDERNATVESLKSKSSTSSSSNSDSGIFYDDEEDFEESKERVKTPSKKSPEIKGGATEEEFIVNPTGERLKDPSMFYTRMKQRDPVLFETEEGTGYVGYSRVCQSSQGIQPVILNEKEFKKLNPESYKNDYIKYGSDPSNPNYFICPRYWCLMNNSSMTIDDVKEGKCAKVVDPSNPSAFLPDKIIPKNSKTVPSDAFVYEFNNPKEHMKNGEYIYHHPGFKVGYHPKGFGLPCCFKKPKQHWEFNQEKEKPKRGRPIKIKVKDSGQDKGTAYVISNETFPIRQRNRFGFLPTSVQFFLQTDNNACVTENNTAIIKSDTNCILRFGVEQVKNQSILGSIAELYSHSQGLQTTPSVKELKDIMIGTNSPPAISLDKFIYYNNSYLVSVFKPKKINIEDIDMSKYENTQFYKTIDINNESQVEFLEDTIAAYENFMKYLSSDTEIIDHTYLWDIVTDDNPLFIKGGINLVLIDVPNNDITENIKIICPTNSQSKLFDSKKETMILLKRDEFYEPIYMYRETDGEIKKQRTFFEQTAVSNIKRILKIIQKTTLNKCVSQPSLPRVYKFKMPNTLNDVYFEIKKLDYLIETQVMNYQGKIIGLIVRQTRVSNYIFIPCLPSAKKPEMTDIPVKIMDEVDGIWNDYKTTVEELKRVHAKTNKKLNCNPVFKVLDDGLIVGVITLSNQFVQINPPSENVIYDDLPTIKGSNYIIADKTITVSKKADKEREEMIKNISLESQFYSLFRSTIRNLLNKYENRSLRQLMIDVFDNENILYRQKLKTVIDIVKNIAKDKIAFDYIDVEALTKYEELSCVGSSCGEQEYCIKKDDGMCQLVIPKNHLISGVDNEIVYFGRIADELIRYKRVRIFMMQPKTYLNITNSEYKIKDDEFILIQTSLNNDYFKNLIPFNPNSYISNVNYYTAFPQTSQPYSNEAISLKEQYAENYQESEDLNDTLVECIKEVVEVIGNVQESIWKRIFPKKSKEIIFKNTSNNCSFYPLIYAFQDKYKTPISVQSVKLAIWNGYKEFFPRYKEKILKILLKQGKKSITRAITQGLSIEAAIISEEYYLTDLDIWAFAKNSKLQICLFSRNKLKGINENLEWLILGQNFRENHYFIRSPPLGGPNKVPAYNLIMPSYGLGELGEFENIVQNAVSGRVKELGYNIQTMNTYLENIVL